MQTCPDDHGNRVSHQGSHNSQQKSPIYRVYPSMFHLSTSHMLLLLWVAGSTTAFTPFSAPTPTRAWVEVKARRGGGRSVSATVRSLKTSVISLAVSKKPKYFQRESSSETKVTDPVELLKLYMTPWRNPNSIFVYFLFILIALGKYNETKGH